MNWSVGARTRMSSRTSSNSGRTFSNAPVNGRRARAGADPDVAALLGGIAVFVHNGDREGEPTDPLAECAGNERVWFVDFHD